MKETCYLVYITYTLYKEGQEELVLGGRCILSGHKTIMCSFGCLVYITDNKYFMLLFILLSTYEPFSPLNSVHVGL